MIKPMHMLGGSSEDFETVAEPFGDIFRCSRQHLTGAATSDYGYVHRLRNLRHCWLNFVSSRNFLNVSHLIVLKPLGIQIPQSAVQLIVMELLELRKMLAGSKAFS